MRSIAVYSKIFSPIDSGSTENVILKWKFGEKNSVTIEKDISLPQMDLLGVKGKEYVDEYSSGASVEITKLPDKIDQFCSV